MAEEILEKNQPSESSVYGDPNPGLYQGQGAVAAGGIGDVTDPAAGVVGNIPNANYGVTTGPNAVNPTGVAGGILNPEQARRFIDYVWDATVLAQDGRRVTMRANTKSSRTNSCTRPLPLGPITPVACAWSTIK